MSRPADEPIPLARLFAMAYRLLVDDMHEQLRARGWTDVRPAFGFVLLAARDGQATSSGLAGLMGVTKQAASKLLDVMEESGYVTRASGASDGRVKTIGLTALGHRLLADVERIYEELEAQWASTIGAKEVDRIRLSLERVIRSAYDGELPPIRPTF